MLRASQSAGTGKRRGLQPAALQFQRRPARPAPPDASQPLPLTLAVDPVRVVGPLAAILLAMTAIVVILPVMADLAGRSPQQAIPRSLDFRQEANIPTLFSTALIFLAAVLSALAGRSAGGPPGRRADGAEMVWPGFRVSVHGRGRSRDDP